MQGVFTWLNAMLNDLLNIYLPCRDQSEPCNWDIIQLDRVNDLACLYLMLLHWSQGGSCKPLGVVSNA